MEMKLRYEAPALKSEPIQVGVFGCNYGGGNGYRGRRFRLFKPPKAPRKVWFLWF